MYAVVNHLQLTKPVDNFLDPLSQEGLPLLANQPGFNDFYFVKVSDNQAILMIVWQDATTADNGTKMFDSTWFAKNMAPYLASQQQRSTGEVLVTYNP